MIKFMYFGSIFSYPYKGFLIPLLHQMQRVPAPYQVQPVPTQQM